MRRFLLFLCFVPICAFAQIPSTSTVAATLSCETVPLPKPLNLTPIAGDKFTVTVKLTTAYGTHTGENWTELRRQRVCEAAFYFAQVWSSEEFKKQLEDIPSLINGKKLLFFSQKKSGKALYSEFIKTKNIIMPVSLWKGVPNCGVTAGDETSIQPEYVDDRGTYSCGNPIVAALTNTLSHEYTHYGTSVASTDSGLFARGNRKWVSYGIGCLTQNIAFPGTCTYK